MIVKIEIPDGSNDEDSNDWRADQVRPFVEAIAAKWNSDNLAQCIADLIADLCHMADRLSPEEAGEHYDEDRHGDDPLGAELVDRGLNAYYAELSEHGPARRNA